MSTQAKNYLLEAVRVFEEYEEHNRRLKEQVEEQSELIKTLQEINGDLHRQVKKLQEVQQLRLMQVLDESEARKRSLNDVHDDVSLQKKLLDLVHPISPNKHFLVELQDILTMQAASVKFRTKANLPEYYRELGKRIIQSVLKHTRGKDDKISK